IACLGGVVVTLWIRQVIARAEAERVIPATVQITTVTAAPDYAKPWQLKATKTVSGSGAIIGGNRILTNAHIVAWAANIEVRRPGLQKKFSAHVLHVDHTCDLALLTADDSAFFQGVAPLEIGEMPRVESPVAAYGYPIGGETASATSGIVSRLEEDTYVHSDRDLLVVQIDAALNPGNSGGPVIGDGKIVAIAMQGLEDAENVGYGIPAPMIARFLVDAEDGKIAGVPRMGAYCLPMENEALRRYLGLGEKQTGSIVVDAACGSAAWGNLQRDDVILAVDGLPVANDCTIQLAGGARTEFSYAIERKQVGESAVLSVWRGGREQNVSLALNDYRALVSAPSYPRRCRYRIAGGIVFQPVDMHCVESLEDYVPPAVYKAVIGEETQTPDRRELVLITSILPHSVNRGYEDWVWDLVESVQGIPVRDFDHFNQLLDEADGQWINITLDDASRLVIDRGAARAADEELLLSFGLPGDRWPMSSEGLVAAR
ncbi:MAG: protease, partial [Candidatus Krumholzibacteriota bacterium]|nr:protease [Candidatus Krumholzibacteriota bacterium]